MKTFVASLILTALIGNSLAQSNSFNMFREKFQGGEDVHHFAINGFFTRMIFRLATEDEWKDAVKEVKNIRIVTVPKAAFEKEKVTVEGFKYELRKDAFEELAHAREKGKNITLYIQSTLKNDNRYMVLIDEPYVVTLVEFKGKVDPDVLLRNGPLSFNKPQ
jgi:hypothetical protein